MAVDAAGSDGVRVRLSAELHRKIREQALGGLPNEICGYVSAAEPAFRDGSFLPVIVIEEVHPLRNVDESPEHYRFDPAEQFEVFKRVSNAGGRLVGTYHSHPETPSRMSEEDIRLAQDEKMIYGIYAVQDELLNFFTVGKDDKGEKKVSKLITEIGD